MRHRHDCVEYIKHVMLSTGVFSEEEWEEFDKDVKKQVKEWVKECLQESPPDASQLTSDIYYGELPTFVRGIENTDRLL